MSRSVADSVSDGSARRRGVLVVCSIVLALSLGAAARSAGGLTPPVAAGKNAATREGPNLSSLSAHYWVDRGKRIVFEASSDGRTQALWVMNADGQHIRKLAPDSYLASVSADGHLLARLVELGQQRHRLIIRTLAGRQVRVLTFRAAYLDDSRPAWARDKSAVAFTGSSDGQRAFARLYVAERLKSIRVIARGRFLYEPAWSPDGRLLAFLRCPTESPNTGCDLMVTRRDGSHTRVVARNIDTNDPSGLSLGIAPPLSDPWSPNGHWLVFAQQPVFSPHECPTSALKRPRRFLGGLF